MMTTSHLKENTPSTTSDDNITNSSTLNPSSSNSSASNPFIATSSSSLFPTTIFHNQQSYNLKHPLQYPWRFSIKLGKILGSSSKENWENAVQEANLFDTIEDFWCLYNSYVKSVDGMPEGSDYFFFKGTVQPQWEDSQNVGQISINITSNTTMASSTSNPTFNPNERERGDRERERERGDRGSSSNRRVDPILIDKIILYTWLSLIGCQLENHQDINGFVFSKRGRGDRLQLWIKSTDPSVHENIRSSIKNILSQQCSIENVSFSSFENFENKRHGVPLPSGSGGSSGNIATGSSGSSGSHSHSHHSHGHGHFHSHSSYSQKNSSSRNNSIDDERGNGGGGDGQNQNQNHRHNTNTNNNRLGGSFGNTGGGTMIGDNHNPQRGKEGGFSRINTTRRH